MKQSFFLQDVVYHDLIECLIAALEAKDPYTSGHSLRVGDMAMYLAKCIGLSEDECEIIHMVGHLHDIGKIGVPDSVLLKTGKLNEEEWHYIKQHPQIGYQILHRSPHLEHIAKIVLHHHERWDGRGYPHGIKETDIPLGSRIIAICDTIDAMTSTRPYRTAFSFEQCRREIELHKGTQFDPMLVEAVKSLWDEWEDTYHLLGNYA